MGDEREKRNRLRATGIGVGFIRIESFIHQLSNASRIVEFDQFWAKL